AYRIATAPPLEAKTAGADAPSLSGGTVLAIANPKAWVAIAAVFASARLVDAATTDAVAKTTVLTTMIILIMTTWLIAGASLAACMLNARRALAVIGADPLAVPH